MYLYLLKKYIQCNICSVAVRPSYIQEARFLTAVCFSRNLALFLDLLWIYVMFNWLEVGFILTGTEVTKEMNHLKIVSLKRWYLNTRLYSVTIRMPATLIVTTGRTSNLTDPRIKKDCLGKADVNLWLWDHKQDRNQWRAFTNKVTKLWSYIKCLEFLHSLGNYCLLNRDCVLGASQTSVTA
jgi:hypothetical protein